jgi:3'-phosphoadenosine 5'-phosphosulfate (PAPS) 3'-phosphatase/thiamine kinase-like enzyme
MSAVILSPRRRCRYGWYFNFWPFLALNDAHHIPPHQVITILHTSMSPLLLLLATTMSSSTTIPTLHLLSGIIDAAHHGSTTIQRLSQEAWSETIQYKEAGDARSAMTIADTAAQKIIISSLLKTFPGLNIVGEEDDSVEVDENAAVELNLRYFGSDGDESFFEAGVYDDLMPTNVKMNDICIYVDPLDGTREFVEGRLENVQCLIGLSHRNTPFMGAIGLPFAPGNVMHSKVQVVYGLVGRGIGKVTCQADADGAMVKTALPTMTKYVEGESTLTVSSGDSTGGLLLDSVAVIEKTLPGVERQIAGACGNKLIKVISGDSTMSVMHHKTSLWDTCAPTALLAAVGGKVTDLFGEPLLYVPDATELGNKLGVLASTPGAIKLHAKVTAAMRADSKVLASAVMESTMGYTAADITEAQCVDIVRDLDGYPLDKPFFDNILGQTVQSFSCPEGEAIRGLMSNGCRVHFDTKDGAVHSAFYKRIVFGHLDHARVKLKTAPHKLVRDVKSYQVETSLLASQACQQVIAKTGIRIPKCYNSALRPNDEHPIESRFSVLLEDFSPIDGWSQRWLIRTKEDSHAVLSTFAKLHAYFWAGSDFWTKNEDATAGPELVDAVWKSASYVQPALQTLNQCQQVEAGWMKNREKCRAELEGMEYWDNLGTRLQRVTEQVGCDAHPFQFNQDESLDQFKTLIHGDPKQTNIFFQQEKEEDDLQVGLIDFQWSGFGLAASDIAHHLSAASHADLLEEGGEIELLEYYYTELTTHLVEYGAYSSTEAVASAYSFDLFFEQYETAILDMCRLVIAYAWSRFEPVTNKKDYARTANKNSYNKSLPNAVWLMNRCHEILTKRGVV